MEPGEIKDALYEAKIMEVLHHPNIIGFEESYNTKSGKLCMIMEYADGGDL